MTVVEQAGATADVGADGVDRGRVTAVERYRLDVVATALVCLPILWAGVVAAQGDWMPVGDDAYFTLRSLDVGTEHHPLLGAWSSGSADTDRSVNNLGPIQLDLLAPFTRWTPFGGTAIAVAVWNAACVAAIAWLLRRLGGRRVVVASMVPVALLCWTMGSEMLITPRQHQFLVVTYLCFLVAAWAAAAGDRWAITIVVVTASMLTQTHLSYPILVAPVIVVACVGQFLAARASTARRGFHRAWIAAAIVGVVLWIQTLTDQVVGRGNLGDVLATSSSAESPGWWRAIQLVGGGTLDPRLWVRPGYADYAPDVSGGRVGSMLGAALIGLLIGLVAMSVITYRAGRVVAASGLAVAAVAVAASIVDAERLPYTVFGLPAGNYRWLLPTVTFLLIGASAAGVHWLERSTATSPASGRWLVPTTWIACATVAVLALASLPRSLQVPNPDRYSAEQTVTAALIDQLRDADLSGPVVIDQSNMYFGHPYGYPTALALRMDGLDYRFTEPDQEWRFGSGRVADGSEPTRLVLWSGDEALAVRDDPATVAFVESPRAVAITALTDGER